VDNVVQMSIETEEELEDGAPLVLTR
jgi:hypothetical protein